MKRVTGLLGRETRRTDIGHGLRAKANLHRFCGQIENAEKCLVLVLSAEHDSAVRAVNEGDTALVEGRLAASPFQELAGEFKNGAGDAILCLDRLALMGCWDRQPRLAGQACR